MAATAAPMTASAPPVVEILRSLAKHLTAFYIPGWVLVFLLTGPHVWYVTPLFMVPMAFAHQIDCGPRRETGQPDAAMPAWPFDGLVYALAALQFWIVIETVRLFTVQGIFSLDMVFTFLLVGGASGFSIITAHELIHRRSRGEQTLGRLLLCTVLYEHFYTEHLRGHHLRVGTPDDPATARFGEPYEAFFRRTLPAQFRSAWRLEKRRLGNADMGLLDRRMLRNRVLHGLVLEWGIAFTVLSVFGFASFVAFLVQAWAAVRLLEAVNYFEHWGLERRGPRVRPVDSWDTHSWFTYYGLIGLSRHADHHAYPARTYTELRVYEQAPILPYGYVGMVDLVLARDDDFQKLATAELARRRLGPFVPRGATVDEKVAAPDERAALDCLERAREDERAGRESGRITRTWRSLPLNARRALFFGALILVAAVGVQWETMGAEMGVAARFLACAWTLGAFALVIPLRTRVETTTGNETLSWVVATAILFVLGWVPQILLCA